MIFELQRTNHYDRISIEFTVDREKPEIRTSYSPTAVWRIQAEIGASEWISKHNPQIFESDRAKLTEDLALFSLVSFFTSTEPDWQMKETWYQGSVLGRIGTRQSISKDHECSIVSESELKQRLAYAKNLFSQSPLIVLSSRGLCLPPGSAFNISPGALTVHNPFCELRFRLEDSGAVSYMKPGEKLANAPQLAPGDPRFETRLLSLTVETTYYAMRSYHRDMEKYRAWRTRVVTGLQKWFEPVPRAAL